MTDKEKFKKYIEETVSEELEKTSDDYAHSTLVGSPSVKKNAFKAGARWQQEKDKKWLADNHKQIFNNGYAEGFENGRDDMYNELSKNSVDGIVQDDYQVKLSTGTYIDFDPSLKRKIPFNVEGGDKIRIIVIKEE